MDFRGTADHTHGIIGNPGPTRIFRHPPRMPFLGREAELAQLVAAFERARSGEPQAVVLVGESRLGKTRIVQECFARLSQQFDPADYWPPALESTDDSLLLNPQFDNARTSASEAPWVWWGLRWTAPSARNRAVADSCAALAGASELRPHVEAAVRQRARRAAEKNAVIGAGKTLLNLATLGSAGTVIEIFERFQDWSAVRKAATAVDESIAERRARETGSRLDELLELLRTLCFSPAVAEAGVPLIVVLDDAQWADADSLGFLRRLLGMAQEAKRSGKVTPALLLIATCWEREWNAAEASLQTATTFPTTLAAALRDGERTGGLTVETIRLARLRDADGRQLVLEALPGLNAQQANLVAERAGGSPGLLVEIVQKLRRSRHLFTHRDLAGPLTAAGEREVRSMDVAYHALVEERLSDMDDSADADVTALLRLASYLGMQFSGPVLAALARRVHERGDELAGSEVVSALTRAETPLALIQTLSTQLREFRLPIYREVLRRQLAQSDSLLELVRDEVPRLIEEMLLDGGLETLTAAERTVFLAFASEELEARLGDGELTMRGALMAALAEQLSDLAQSGRVDTQRRLLDRWWTLWQEAGELPMMARGARRLRAVLLAATEADRSHLVCPMLDTLDAAGLSAEYWSTREIDEYRASALRDTGDAVGAGALYERLVANAQNAVDAAPDDERAMRKLAQALNGLATALHDQGDDRGSTNANQRSLAIHRLRRKRWGESRERLQSLAVEAMNIAFDAIDNGDYEQALSLLDETAQALALCRERFGEEVEQLRLEGLERTRVAEMHSRQDNHELACAAQRDGIALMNRLIAEFGESGDRLTGLAAQLQTLSQRLKFIRPATDPEPLALSVQARECIEHALSLFGETSHRLYVGARCAESEIDCRIALDEAQYGDIHVDTLATAAELAAWGLSMASACVAGGDAALPDLQLLYTLQGRCSAVAQMQRDLDRAIAHLQEARAIGQRVVAEYPSAGLESLARNAEEAIEKLEERRAKKSGTPPSG